MASKRNFEAFSSSCHRPWKYHVFLNFRGIDTRKNFTDHLYHALKDAGINTYRDNNELRRGGYIPTELPRAIQDSKLSLIVFSRNYADSRWCLDELVTIMERRETVQHEARPIFYDVDASEVRHQTGSYGEALAKHEGRFMADMGKVSRWRAALTKAADLSGWNLRADENGYEAVLIKKIVEDVLSHLNITYLNIAKYPVGIDSRVQYMKTLLRVGLKDVRITGICAMDGMGKTTITKALFNQLFDSFQHRSFIANMSEISKQTKGLVHLQEQLLFDILKMKDIKVSNVDRGIDVIKERLRGRKVLVVLDDVNQLGQLNAILGKRDWLGLGSRIIITTEDIHLLEKIKVDATYMLDGLDCSESLELFSWHAFKKPEPEEDYIELSNEVIRHCERLPLALEVLGSLLYGRCKPEWKSQLKKLKRIPSGGILEKLKISYDELEDYQKVIFLDIACFFNGVEKDDVVEILEGCGFNAKSGISVLVERCLLNINFATNKLTMNEKLQRTGREIVRKESPNGPENCSRLWFYDDVLNILTKHKGTKAVEGLMLNLPRLNKVHLSTKELAKMRKLRLLQLNYVRDMEGNDDILKELRWLCWHGFPKTFIPNNFHIENVVAIEMQYSKLRQVWKGIKVMEKLTSLDLSHSHLLTKTPDFSRVPSLKKLILEDCTSLLEIHPSIGKLGRLILMNMRDCKQLKILPRSICRLKSLEILDLSNCSKLETLPEDLGEMEALIELLVDGTVIRQVPSSIVRLKYLRNLSFRGRMGSPSSSLASASRSWKSPRGSLDSTSLILPASLMGLCALRVLDLSDCNLSDMAIPIDLGSLFSLRVLNIERNNFTGLPFIIKAISKLVILILNYCTRLQELPQLPTSLACLYAYGCISLKSISYPSHFPYAPHFFLDKCHKLFEIRGLDKSQAIGSISMEGCNNLSNAFKESIIQGQHNSTFLFPGSEIPQWFSHQWKGLSSSFQLPATLGCKIPNGISLCALYERNIDPCDPVRSLCHITYGPMGTKISIEIVTPGDFEANSTQDHILVTHSSFHDARPLYDGDQVEVQVIMKEEFNVKMFGVHLFYDDAKSGSTPSNSGQLNPCKVIGLSDDEDIFEDRDDHDDDDFDDDGDDEVGTSSQSNSVQLNPCKIIVLSEDEDLLEDSDYEDGDDEVGLRLELSHKDTYDDDDDDDEAGPSHGWFDEYLEDYDDEAGPSHGWSDEAPHPKRLKYQAGSSENPITIDDP